MSYWLATVSADHVYKGMEEGIMQVCHGKKAPLKRIRQNDYIVFYSPRRSRHTTQPCQKFTAVARATDDIVYQVRMHDDFKPFRRRVRFLPCREADIRPLIADLTFIVDKQRWGYPLRYGLLKIPEEDFKRITEKMEWVDEI